MISGRVQEIVSAEIRQNWPTLSSAAPIMSWEPIGSRLQANGVKHADLTYDMRAYGVLDESRTKSARRCIPGHVPHLALHTQHTPLMLSVANKTLHHTQQFFIVTHHPHTSIFGQHVSSHLIG